MSWDSTVQIKNMVKLSYRNDDIDDIMKEETDGNIIVGVPAEINGRFEAHKNVYYCGRIDTKLHKQEKDRHEFVIKIINREYGIYEIEYNFSNF